MLHYGHMIRILSGCISHSMTDAVGEMELTSAQGRIMGFLARCENPPCPKDVEEEFGLSHPTVSGLLGRLEKKGFVALHPDPDDRRCKRIFILPRGQDCNGKIYHSILENEARIVQGFSVEEKTQFADFLARAVHNMGGELPVSCHKEESEE